MNLEDISAHTNQKLTAVTKHFEQEISKIRTGRAHPSMLDGIMVEAYGQAVPLKAVAGITTPEAQLIQISPFDPNNLKAISDAIRSDQNLGLSPTDDGRLVRISLPPMTAETRAAMVKILHQKEEDAYISARQIRHDSLKQAEQAEKNKLIGKDELNRLEKRVDELISKQKIEIELLTKNKENEILTI